MIYEVVFAPEAQQDLLHIYDFITDHSEPQRALNYVEQIMTYCTEFSTFPERGTRYDDIRPGLRTVAFKSRVTIAFHVGKDTVTIDRILYAGRDINKAFFER